MLRKARKEVASRTAAVLRHREAGADAPMELVLDELRASLIALVADALAQQLDRWFRLIAGGSGSTARRFASSNRRGMNPPRYLTSTSRTWAMSDERPAIADGGCPAVHPTPRTRPIGAAISPGSPPVRSRDDI